MNDFVELLNVVTTDSRDNGEVFTVTDRISVIEKLLASTDYKLVANEPLVRLYSKRNICEGDTVVLVSSHADSLYEACFCRDEGEFLRGTFDNSLTNAAILSLMLQGALPDNVVVAFTGDEEHDSQGAVQTVLALGRMGCVIKFAVILDVTNTGWENGACLALENDLGVDLLTAHRIVETVDSVGVKYEFKHDAEPDESWDYNDYGIPALSLCVPVGGDLHSDKGVHLCKESLAHYMETLSVILNNLT